MRLWVSSLLPPLDYSGFLPNGNRQGPGRRQLSLTGGGGGPPGDPPDDEDEDDDDEEDEEDEEEEEDDSRTRRGRRRLRDDREIKNERPRISRKEAERVSIPPWPKIARLDQVDLPRVLQQRCLFFQSPPKFLRGPFRAALSLALLVIDSARPDDETEQTRAWILWLLLPRLLLHRRPGTHRLTKPEWRARLRD